MHHDEKDYGAKSDTTAKNIVYFLQMLAKINDKTSSEDLKHYARVCYG